jgi:hypothetical protein
MYFVFVLIRSVDALWDWISVSSPLGDGVGLFVS